MARTTSAAVQAILGDNYDTVGLPSLTPFIETASVMVDSVRDCAADDDTPLTNAQLEMIERWLAAHFYHCSDPTYQSKSTEGASGQFMGTSGEGLKGSRYGQTAMALDPSGCLASQNPQTRASMFWGGKPVSDQIHYDDRN